LESHRENQGEGVQGWEAQSWESGPRGGARSQPGHLSYPIGHWSLNLVVLGQVEPAGIRVERETEREIVATPSLRLQPIRFSLETG